MAADSRSKTKTPPRSLKIQPLTSSRWKDFTELFGSRGACGGCWCMYPRLKNADFERMKGAANRRAMKRLVDRGQAPGVIAYAGKNPVGWCSIEPRESFSRLERSRILKPVDDRPVWSIVCLFVAKEHRRSGVSIALIEGAVDHARRKGARIVEAYPVEPTKGSMPDVFAYYGVASAYAAAGFKEVARRSETRPIMRRTVKPLIAGKA